MEATEGFPISEHSVSKIKHSSKKKTEGSIFIQPRAEHAGSRQAHGNL